MRTKVRTINQFLARLTGLQQISSPNRALDWLYSLSQKDEVLSGKQGKQGKQGIGHFVKNRYSSSQKSEVGPMPCLANALFGLLFLCVLCGLCGLRSFRNNRKPCNEITRFCIKNEFSAPVPEFKMQNPEAWRGTKNLAMPSPTPSSNSSLKRADNIFGNPAAVKISWLRLH